MWQPERAGIPNQLTSRHSACDRADRLTIVCASHNIGTARFALVTVNVNLRSRPGTDAEILATIPAGSRVEVTDCSEWCMVALNGQRGFAIARNLDIGGTRQGRTHRTAPQYAGAPPGLYDAEPPVIYGPPRQ
jgi:uncharacterized protein YraI